MGMIMSVVKAFLSNTRATIQDINTRYWGASTGFHILILVYSGFWPLANNEKNRYLRFMKFLPYFALVGCFITILISFYDLTFKLGNYVLLAEAITFLISLTKALIITIIAIFKIDEIAGIFAKLDNLARYIVHEQEKAIFNRYQKIIINYTIFVVSTFAGHALIFCLQPMFEAERRFPMHYTLPVTSPIFEIVYIGALLIGVGSMLIVGIADALIISGFIVANGFLEILQYKVEHVKEFAEMKVMARVDVRGVLYGDSSHPQAYTMEVDGDHGGSSQPQAYTMEVDGDHELGEDVWESSYEATTEGITHEARRDLEEEMSRHLVDCVEFHKEILQ